MSTVDVGLVLCVALVTLPCYAIVAHTARVSRSVYRLERRAAADAAAAAARRKAAAAADDADDGAAAGNGGGGGGGGGGSNVRALGRVRSRLHSAFAKTAD